MDPRIIEISELIIKMAGGDFKSRCKISDHLDQIDAIAVGINMLGEELEASTVSSEYLKSIYSGIADVLFILDENGAIIDWNSTAITELGFSEEEIRVMTFTDLDHEKDQNKVNLANVKKKKIVRSINKILKNKNGDPINFSCSFSNLYDKQQKFRGIICIAKDIGDLVKKEAELAQKVSELNTLIYKISHDIKGPLSSIIGLTTISAYEVKEEKATGYFAMIKERSERLNSIINDLVATIRTRDSIINYEEINLVEMLNEIIKSLQYSSDFSNIKFNVYCNPDFVVTSDRSLLLSILQNILDNSIKYRDTKKKSSVVNIFCEQHEKNIEIIISDNGLGVPEHLKDKIFDMFYRASNQSAGSGLGLYLVRNAVKRLGGEITIDTKEFEGATFKVTIPFVLSSEEV